MRAGSRGSERRFPSRVAEAAAAAAAADAQRLNALFDVADVALTPMFTRRPPRVRDYDGRPGLVDARRHGPARARTRPRSTTRASPRSSVPAGFTADGFPLAVQLVGPPDSEARLLSLSAQLEQARDWATPRPAVAA